MDIDRDKAIKLVIIVIGTLAALAVMGILMQLIQTVLPFLIVAAGVYVGYRWVLSDSAAPTADEVEEQTRGLFSRFRKTRQAVETTVKAGAALNELQNKPEKKQRRRRRADAAKAEDKSAAEAQQKVIAEIKQTLENSPESQIEFEDGDVIISKDDLALPDISRLEEKEKEEPQVNNSVRAQIEERRRRLRGSE